MSKPTFDGLVRSNFWKGRQRLNRLYRWIANVVRPKIDVVILFQSSPQNNPDVHDFLIAPKRDQACMRPEISSCNGKLPSAPRHELVVSFPCTISRQLRSRLPAAELAARRCTTRAAAATRTLV